MLWAADRDGISHRGKALEVFGLAERPSAGPSAIRSSRPHAAAQERIDLA